MAELVRQYTIQLEVRDVTLMNICSLVVNHLGPCLTHGTKLSPRAFARNRWQLGHRQAVARRGKPVSAGDLLCEVREC